MYFVYDFNNNNNNNDDDGFTDEPRFFMPGL